MADERVVTVDGKPISELRVVDLKKELDKRRLSKSGSKKELIERLRSVTSSVYFLFLWSMGEIMITIFMNTHTLHFS